MESGNPDRQDALTDAPPSEEEMHKRLLKLEKMYRDFRIVGDGTINFQGDMRKGFTATLDE
jgi:hypothetical protein